MVFPYYFYIHDFRTSNPRFSDSKANKQDIGVVKTSQFGTKKNVVFSKWANFALTELTQRVNIHCILFCMNKICAHYFNKV